MEKKERATPFTNLIEKFYMRHFDKEVKRKGKGKIIKGGKEREGNPFHTSSRETHHETF